MGGGARTGESPRGQSSSKVVSVSLVSGQALEQAKTKFGPLAKSVQVIVKLNLMILYNHSLLLCLSLCFASNFSNILREKSSLWLLTHELVELTTLSSYVHMSPLLKETSFSRVVVSAGIQPGDSGVNTTLSCFLAEMGRQETGQSLDNNEGFQE